MFNLYYYYVINLIENQIDSFFSHVNNNENLEDQSKNNISSSVLFLEFSDLLKYFFSFRFEEFFFFFNKFYSEYSKRNSYFFYFIFLFMDLFSFISFFLISHSWISLKIYKDYVHNSFRRRILKVLAMFLLIFLLIFVLFFFFLL